MENNRLWKIYITVLEMLEYRGYKLTDTIKQNKNMSFDEFFNIFSTEDKKFINKNLMMISLPEIQVHFIDNTEISDDKIRSIFNSLKENVIKNVILVIKHGDTKRLLSAQTILLLQEIEKQKKYFFEYFDDKTLEFNISKHSYVNKHKKLEGPELDDFKKKFNLVECPLILRGDPMAKFIGLRPGLFFLFPL